MPPVLSVFYMFCSKWIVS